MSNNSFNSNLLRADIPSDVAKVSEGLFSYLQEQAESLREFYESAKVDAVIVPPQETQVRGTRPIYPIGARASTILVSGKLTRLEYVQFLNEPAAEPTLVFYADTGKVDNAEGRFAGVDYTTAPALGEYGWIAIEGPVPELEFESDVYPIYFGATPSGFSHLTESVAAFKFDKNSVIELAGFELGKSATAGGSAALVETVELLRTQMDQLLESVGILEDIDLNFLMETAGGIESVKQQVLLSASIAARDASRVELLASAISEKHRAVQVQLESAKLTVGLVSSLRDQVQISRKDSMDFARASRSESARAKVSAENANLFAQQSLQSKLEAQVSVAGATAQASIATQAAVLAEEARAYAETVLTLMASVGATIINGNPGFDTWAVSTNNPDDWTGSAYDNGHLTRIAGYTAGSTYAMKISVPAGSTANHRMIADPQPAEEGWYVMDCIFKLEAGAFNESVALSQGPPGIVLIGEDSGGTEINRQEYIIKDLLDATGAAYGAGTIGLLYRFSKLFHLVGAAITQVRPMIRIFGGGVTPTGANVEVSVDYFSARLANDAEIAAQTVLADVGGTLATHTSQISVLATDVAAHTSSLTSLTSAYSGLSSSLATLTSNYTTTAGTVSSHAGLITTINTTLYTGGTGLVAVVGTHTSQISSLSTENGNRISDIATINSNYTTLTGTTLVNMQTELTAATSANSAQGSQITTLKAQVGLSGNLLKNSSFVGGYFGWTAGGSSGTWGWGINGPGDSWTPSGEKALTIYQPDAATGVWGDWLSAVIPIESNKWYQFSVWAAAHRCQISFHIGWFTDSQAVIYYSSTGGFTVGAAGNPATVEGYTRNWLKAQAPNNAKFARIIVRKEATNSGSDSWAWFLRPMFSEVTADTTLIPPFQHSAQVAQITEAFSVQASQAGAIATIQGKYSLYIDSGDGSVTGYQAIGGGGISEVVWRSDKFLIKTASGNVTPFAVTGSEVRLGVDLYAGAHRVIFDNGSVKLVLGTGFGSSNQFIEWFGPAMAISSMNEGNAISYKKTNGDAYFGGSLSAGTLTTSASTSSTAADAVAETALFGSAGGTISVTYSYNYFHEYGVAHYDTFGGDGSGVSSVSVNLYRKVTSGGAYFHVDTLSLSGAWSWYKTPATIFYDEVGNPVFATPGVYYETESMGGSKTYTDPNNDSNDRQYKAIIVSRSIHFTGGLGTHSQRVGIICVE